jgi:hypothetical protein
MKEQNRRISSKNPDEITVKRLEDFFSESEVKEFDKDTELWETGKLGNSAKHAVRISEEEDKAIDDTLGLQAVTMRLQKELVEQLKLLAKKEGLGYQPYIRQLLTKHVSKINSLPKIRKSA